MHWRALSPAENALGRVGLGRAKQGASIWRLNGSLIAGALLALLVLGASGRAHSQAPSLTPPRVVEGSDIEFPPDAEPLEEDVDVQLLLTISADGEVTDAAIAAGARPDIDALVLDAARRMRFEPATRDGAPIPARIRFTYRVATTRDTTSSDAPLGSLPPDSPAQPTSIPDSTDSNSMAADSMDRSSAPDSIASDSGGEARSDRAATSAPESESSAEVADHPDPPADDDFLFVARAEVDRPEPGATTRITLTAEELTTVPGTFGEPLRVVATFPGVSRSPFGIGFFVVRGANFQSTGFLIDGFPVPLLYHFAFGPAVISSRLVSKLQFYPGNYPVRYGRFSGGLISVETGPFESDSFHAEIELDLLRAAALVAIPFDNGRGHISLSFRRSYYDLLLPLFVDGVYLHYTDYQLHADYRFDRYFSASVFVFGSDDVLDQSGAIGGGATSDGSNTNFGIQFQRVIAKLTWRLAPDSTLTLAGSLGRDLQHFGSRSVGQDPQTFDLETFNAGLRVDADVLVAEWLSVRAGLDLAGTTTNIDVTAPLPTGLGRYPAPIFQPELVTLRARAARGLPGSYGEAVLRFDPVEISAGLRLDLLRYGTLTQLAADPRLVVRTQILPEWLIKAGTGLFTQPPAALQTVSTGGNPALGPSRAWQSSLGTEVQLPLDVGIEVNGFYSAMYDLARFAVENVEGPNGTVQRQAFVADQEGRAYGLELLIRRPVQEGFYAWLSYTWSRSERKLPDGQWELFNQDQEHVLNLVGSYSVDGWRFGGRFVLATGRPIANIEGGVYDADGDFYSANPAQGTSRVNPYHQLDLRIDRDFDIGPVTGTVYLDVLNVYYAQNSEGVIYQYDFQRSAGIPGIPILGTIGVRAAYE